jgi:hypothetical protein
MARMPGRRLWIVGGLGCADLYYPGLARCVRHGVRCRGLCVPGRRLVVDGGGLCRATACILGRCLRGPDWLPVLRANASHWLRAGADDDGAFGRRYSFLGASSWNTVARRVCHGIFR